MRLVTYLSSYLFGIMSEKAKITMSEPIIDVVRGFAVLLWPRLTLIRLGICFQGRVTSVWTYFPPLQTIFAFSVHSPCKYIVIFSAGCYFSPFECEMPQYGINLDVELVNSEFYKGIVVRKLSEPKLSFLQGIFGSFFSMRLNRLLGINDYEDTGE